MTKETFLKEKQIQSNMLKFEKDFSHTDGWYKDRWKNCKH